MYVTGNISKLRKASDISRVKRKWGFYSNVQNQLRDKYNKTKYLSWSF